MLTDEDEARLQASMANDPDNPELADDELAALRPASEALPPALYAALTRPPRPTEGRGDEAAGQAALGPGGDRGVQGARRRLANPIAKPEQWRTDVTPHCLRHTAATWGMQNGGDVDELVGFLGMTVEMLERVYGHHHPDFQEGAAEAVSKRRSPKPDRSVSGRETVRG